MDNIVFYAVEAVILISALLVILVPNPIYSALFLVLSMIGVAGIFVSLEAYFLAALQLIVYAGAITVLFVMVVMLFNLKKESHAFSKGMLGNVIKTLSVVLIWSIIHTAITNVFSDFGKSDLPKIEEGSLAIKSLSTHLFTKYIFAFEAISILLLVVIVGSVALAKSKGGTHD